MEKKTGNTKGGLTFGVWEVGTWRDDWQNLGEGIGENMLQKCGVAETGLAQW